MGDYAQMAAGIQVKAMSARDELHGSLLSAKSDDQNSDQQSTKERKNILRNTLGASQSPFGKFAVTATAPAVG